MQPTIYDSPLTPLVEAAPENTGKGFYVVVATLDSHNAPVATSIKRVKDQEIAGYWVLKYIEDLRLSGKLIHVNYVGRYAFECTLADSPPEMVGMVIKYA